MMQTFQDFFGFWCLCRKKDSDNFKNLDEYCEIHLQSQDTSWKSCIVNAIICPNLHTDLILGLDFLVKNKIVVNAELRTAIVKDTNNNLLNPSPPSFCKPSRSPHQWRKVEAANIKQGQVEVFTVPPLSLTDSTQTLGLP